MGRVLKNKPKPSLGSSKKIDLIELIKKAPIFYVLSQELKFPSPNLDRQLLVVLKMSSPDQAVILLESMTSIHIVELDWRRM